MAFRKLTETEIKILEDSSCSCENWDLIQVDNQFNPAHVKNVNFSGEVTLGIFEKPIPFTGGIKKQSGIFNCTIHNCRIGNNSFISNVNTLANYTVEDNVIIENVNSIIVTGENSFGNGTELEILNEGGGRDLKIYDNLSAQTAYLMVLYRHNDKLIKNLNEIIDEYTHVKISAIGFIKEGSLISNCNCITNVNVGAYSTITGAAKLEDGTIVSCREAPVFIGNGVTASKFIIQSGSTITNFVLLEKCFIGQSVTLGKQFSAENSAFFANCEGFHGEAVSLFAGPYTVTHHKSTLLIAGLFSFYNAGSGSNQSNHMYKLGPLHQGILERGSKTGSFSYLLWPSRVGAFSAVIGKHYTNFDSSDLPFSYISEEEGKSILTPAMNLLTVGTKRDCEKWPARDKRKDPVKLDLINFDLFSPYTVGKMVKGSNILHELYSNAPKEQEFVSYNGLSINRLMLRTAIKYYEMGIKIFIGKTIINKLQSSGTDLTFDELVKFIKPEKNSDKQWIDVSGLLTPADSVEALVEKINNGEINNISVLADELKSLYNNYTCNEWEWAVNLIESRFNKVLSEFTKIDFVKIINDWKENSVKLNNMIAKDAMREFDQSAKIGFGIDGNSEQRDQDFESVRGTYDNNKFVKQLKSENNETIEKANQVIKFIENLS